MALASGRHRNETTSSRSKYPVLHQNPLQLPGESYRHFWKQK
jgi:hypothetical protein